MELDRILPAYDFRSCHTRRIPADPTTTWNALINLTTADLRITRLLMSIRAFGRPRPQGRLLDTMPFETLALIEGRELVGGKISKFWLPHPPDAPIPPGDPAAFTRFSEPGWAKAVMGIRVTATGSATQVTIETRVSATDRAARRAFAVYWPLIRVGGAGFIRLEILRAISYQASPDLHRGKWKAAPEGTPGPADRCGV